MSESVSQSVSQSVDTDDLQERQTVDWMVNDFTGRRYT